MLLRVATLLHWYTFLLGCLPTSSWRALGIQTQNLYGPLCPPAPPPGSLVDKRARIQVPGMYEDVAAVTDEEKQLYEQIEFDLEEYCKDVGVCKLLHATKARIRIRIKIRIRI